MAENTYIPREELIEINNEIAKVRAKATEQLMAIPGVVGVGVGLKHSNGEFQRKLCFKVTVLKKMDKDKIKPAQLIPAVIFGFETDVTEIAPAENGSILVPDDRKYRPLIGGCMIEPSFVNTISTSTAQIIISSSGTLGCLAKVNTGTHNGKIVALTNWHVAVKGTAAIDGERAGQPSHNQCCTCCACNEIGKVIDARLDTSMDAAIILLSGQDADTTPDIRYVNEILDIGIIAGSATHLPGETVYKRGKTSRLTRGQITNDNFTTSALDYNQDFPDHRVVTFVHQLEISPFVAGTLFADHGDSGSVVVNEHNQVIGLLYAGDLALGTAWVTPINLVTAALHIDIIDSTFHSSVAGKEGVPLSSAAVAGKDFITETPFETMEKELRGYKAGIRFMEMFQTHQKEIIQLVNNHREVMTAWNRYQGPAFLAQIIRAFHRNKAIEEQIKGISLQNLLLKMTAVFQRNGSPELAQAVSENYLGVMQVFGSGKTPDEWKARLAEMENTIIL